MIAPECEEMIAIDRPVIVDCAVDETENVMPMIPSGAAHNEMLLASGQKSGGARVTDQGMGLV